MKRWLYAFLSCIAFIQLFIGGSVEAQGGQERGLFVTPPRSYVAVEAGKPTTQTLTIGNTNDTPMEVTLSVEQFSVADFTYDYTFSVPREKWINFDEPRVVLEPKTSKKIIYTLTPPGDATPGGHYFTVLASATLQSGKQIRAAHVLYLTVGGEVVRSSEVVKNHIPFIWTGGDIPVEFDAKNTGNTHFFIYTFANANGWWKTHKAEDVTHVLLPQSIRSIRLTIATPIIPGFYTVQYGFKTEDGQMKEASQSLIYLPVWSIALLVGALWLAIVFCRRQWRRRRRVLRH